MFDRSWYGRVLVERVEGIASKREWQRGYEEINQFERMLVADGVRIVKCFLHITPAEQIQRFKDRLANPLKRWKLTHEDLRNQSRWTDYEVAIEDMLERTSTKNAPWHLIPTNDKPYGRLAAFTILIDRLGEGLRLEPRPLDPRIAEAVGKFSTLRRAFDKRPLWVKSGYQHIHHHVRFASLWRSFANIDSLPMGRGEGLKVQPVILARCWSQDLTRIRLGISLACRQVRSRVLRPSAHH